MSNTKIVCVYHSVDLDGWMSAAIVKHWFHSTQGESYERPYNNLLKGTQNQISFIGYNYGQAIPDLSEYDKVIMCDISFPTEIMEDLSDNKKVIWIDYHISAINNIDRKGQFIDGIRDTNFAACELTWKYFFPNDPMPEIVRLLGRYDCFGHKGTNEEQKVLEFQYGARQCISNYEEAYDYLIHTIEVFNINDLEKYGKNTKYLSVIQEQGKIVYKYLCTEAKQTYKNGFKIILWLDAIPTNEEIRPLPAIGNCDICGKEENKQLTRYYFRYENDKCDCHSPYHFDIFDCCKNCKPKAKNKIPKKFICFNKERFNPVNFGIDYHKDGYDGAACFHYTDGVYNFSLYNDNGKVDCSQIAKQYGGGGHKGAAGMRLTPEQFLKLTH